MNEGLQLLELLLGLLGLALTLNGTYKLFKQIPGLREIVPMDLEKQKSLEKDDLYRDLIAKFNDEIKNSNKLNDDNHKHDKRTWLRQIVFGTIITAISLILSYSTAKFYDKDKCQNSHECGSHSACH